MSILPLLWSFFLIFIKLLLNGQIEYGEVQFYFLQFSNDSLDEVPTTCALVSLYSCPIQELLDESFNTLWACHYMGKGGLQVVELATIIACVSMQPLPSLPNDPPWLWFVLEKSGLEDFQLTGFEEPIDNDPEEL
jgi:hypothetical protein